MFSFNEELFREALNKTQESYKCLISLYSNIQEIEGMGETYEGSSFSIDACYDLKNVKKILEELMFDMLKTARRAGMKVFSLQMNINSLIALGTRNELDGYNLDTYSNEVFSKILDIDSYNDIINILRGLEMSGKDRSRIFHYIQNKDYEKLIIELLYFNEQEQYDKLNDRYNYVNDRINDIENQLTNDGVEKHEFYQELESFKLFLEDNKDNPNLKDYKLLLDDREISFNSYEEGMNYLNNIVGDLNKELKDLKEEKESLEGKINNFDFQIGSVYDYNKGIDLVSNNEDEFQKLLESIDVLENGFYNQVFKVNEYPSNQSINFFLDNENPASGYGCDQGVFKEMSLNDSEYIRLKNKLIKEYGFSRVDATKCIQLVDYEGACSYAAIVDSIIATMDTNPDIKKEIEEKSGVKLYNEEGNLNTAEFLLDFFLYANTFQNGGELFYQEEDGSYHVYENIEITSPTYNAGEVESLKKGFRGTKTVSTLSGDDEEMITSYLKSLSPNLEYESHEIVSSGYSNSFKVKKKVMRLIADGKKLNIGINAISQPIYFQNLTSSEPDIKFESSFFDKDKSFQGDIYSGGHAVNVVGYDYDGVIVDTWGRFYKISWEDVASSSIHVYEEDITLKESN